MYQASLGTVCVQIYSLLFPSSTLCPKKADSRELHFPRLLCQQAAGCWKIEGVERREPWRRESLPTPVFWPGEFHGLYVHEVAKSWTRLSDFFFSLIFISWRQITLQYCSGFCHTLTWISPPDPPSHLPLYPIPLGLPSAPGPSTCLSDLHITFPEKGEARAFPLPWWLRW